MSLESGGSLSDVRFVLVPLFAALTVASTGCGSRTKAPTVASLGRASTNETSSSKPIVPRGGSFVKFVDCLRSHGVDAQLGQGGRGVEITGGPGSASKMSTVQAACRKYLPGGGPKPMTPEEQEKELKYLVKLARCMRAHGVPDFPDPSPNASPPFAITKLPAATPAFERAAKACGATGPNGQGFAIRVRT